MEAFNPNEYWQKITKDKNAEFDFAIALICLYHSFHEGLSPTRYLVHLNKLKEDVAARFDALCHQGACDDLRTRIAALKHVIHDQEGYHDNSDVMSDIIEGSDLIRVIENRAGQAALITLLYMRTALSLGWHIEVLSMPGQPVCRMLHNSDSIIFDPAKECQFMESQDLRARVKAVMGDEAELSNTYFQSVEARDFMIKVLNPVKIGYIESGDYKLALKLVNKMQELAPEEYRLLFDSGVLNARIGQKEKALLDLENYIKVAPNVFDRDDAQQLLYELKSEHEKT